MEHSHPGVNTLRNDDGNGNNFGTLIKSENAVTESLMYSLPSPSHKRKGSESRGIAGKRQRVAATSAMASDDFVSILEGVSASVTQHYQKPPQGQLSHRQEHEQIGSGVPNGHLETATHNRGFITDPYLCMRILSLPVLDSLSTQILSALARGPYHETLTTVSTPESELGQAFKALKSLFDDMKKIYSQPNHGQFLSADDLGIHEPAHRRTIRTTNVATFASSVFQGQDIGFYEANDRFIDIFTPEGDALGSEAGCLYLNFKTQMYLSSLQQEDQDRTKEDILEELFPRALCDIVSERRPGVPLAQTEVNFINSCRERRDYFMNKPSDADSIQSLSEEFSWENFLRSLKNHLINSYALIIDPYMKRYALTAPVPPTSGPPQNYTREHISTRINGDTRSTNCTATQPNYTAHQNHSFQQKYQNGGSSQSYYTPIQNTSFQTQYSGASIPHESQHAPTQVLYEKARQAAVAKSHPTIRRPGLPSQRRPWSQEEEHTLMAGLDQVKGPHWSQILSLYGKGGSINDVLKDRNQVQLKDKARNLKLFFLKNHVEVPYYLRGVTGDLKTRAPSLAAKKAADAREKIGSSEEQARMGGILALANGLQLQTSDAENGLREASASISETSQVPSQENLSSPEERSLIAE